MKPGPTFRASESDPHRNKKPAPITFLTGILAALETAIDDGGEDDGSDAGDPARPDEILSMESGRTRRHPAPGSQFPSLPKA